MSGLQDPFEDAIAVTPSDTEELSAVTRYLYIASGGHVGVVTANGTTLDFQNVQAGTFIPGRFIQVRATGTTAGGIVACW